MFGIKNILSKIDFKFDRLNLLVLPVILFCYLYIKIFHLSDIKENSFLENLQLIPLVVAFALCLKAKSNKVFFNFAAFIIFILFMRELSFGRTIFCTIPYLEGGVYQWSHYKYGFLADYIVALVITIASVMAILNKVHLEFVNVVKSKLFPFWTFIIMIFFAVVALVGEAIKNTVVEEICEVICYSLLLIFVYKYLKK